MRHSIKQRNCQTLFQYSPDHTPRTMASFIQLLSTVLTVMVLLHCHHAEEEPAIKKSNASAPITKDIEEFLGITYTLNANYNFDEYLKGLGVNIVVRKYIDLMKPDVTLTKAGKQYTLAARSILKNVIMRFRLGAKFNYTTVDRRHVQSDIVNVGNQLVELQTDLNTGRSSNIIRLFSSDELRETYQLGDITAERLYKRTS